MTIGSGAWADRLDALLRDRRELFEAQAEENILMVILLAVPRFGALAIAYALLLICRCGAPVVNRLKPVWDRFVASYRWLLRQISWQSACRGLRRSASARRPRTGRHPSFCAPS